MVTETQAPDKLVCTGESKTVTLSAAGENEEVSFSTVTFTNDRQKASVSLVKQDGDTRAAACLVPSLACTQGNDIVSEDGSVIVKERHPDRKGGNWCGWKSGHFSADLPVNNSYYVKELQAPADVRVKCCGCLFLCI